jgi:hypothetical protein
VKSAWIVVLSLFFANFAMAEGAIFEGKEIKGYVAASNHQAMFWLSGNLAETAYDHMKEEARNAENCTGKIKHFPGFLCLKNENSFRCLIKVNLKTGLLEGERGELCKHADNVTRKASLTAKRIYSDEEGMFFYLLGNTAKKIYNQIPAKPIDARVTSDSCLAGLVKRFSGLECGRYKNMHECHMLIDFVAKKVGPLPEMCPQD